MTNETDFYAQPTPTPTEPQIIYVQAPPKQRRWPWILGALLVLGIIGNAMGPDTPTTFTPRQSSTPASDYIDLVRQNGGAALVGVSSTDLLSVGVTICETLTTGVPVQEIASIALQHVTPQAGAAVITSAVMTLCTEHFDAVNRWANNQR